MRSTVLALTALVVASPAFGGERTVRSYGIEGIGTLELEVPIRWTESIGWTEGDHRPKLTFAPDKGESFSLSISVLPPPEEAPNEAARLAWLKGVVERSARTSLGVPEDQDLALEEIGEGAVVGWYYSVADAALPDPPAKGTWRVMTQGASVAGNVVLTATLLTQKQWSDDVAAGLAVLRTAKITKGPADPWRVPGPGVQARDALGQRYDLVIPDDFELESTSPLRLRDRRTGALLSIDVTASARRATARDELRDLERELERRSPGAWITRKREVALLGGRPAAHLVAIDELRDEAVAAWALPLEDAVIALSWRVHPSKEREAEPRLELLLKGFALRP